MGRLLAALVLLGVTSVSAQTARPPRDTTATPPAAAPAPADTNKRVLSTADSAKRETALDRRKRLAADTVKAPLARAELPVDADGRYHWSGEALRAAGATTLADLLARIPGATSFRANWIPAAQFIAYNGDAGRVRVFLDGVELDAIDPRGGSVLDLGVIPIWPLEEVSVEGGAGELRVYLRSWRVDHTTPMTRTDITTGSENTNLYRGYFGKRLHNGGAVQLAAQQYSTTSPRTGGDGSSLQVFGRVGWAWNHWSVDGTVNRLNFDRAATIRFPLSSELVNRNGSPAFKGSLGAAYARAAWGDPDAKGAPWIQLIAATQMMRESSKVSATSALATPTAAPSDTVDSAASRAQYVIAAGASRWGVNASATARMRVLPGRREFSPSMRLGYDWRFVSLAAFAETRGADSTRRVDLSARIAPWRFLTLSGAYGSYAPKSELTGGPSFTASRLELTTSLFGITLSGGMISRGLTTVAAPVALDSSLVRVGTNAAKGVVFDVRGPVWGDIIFDVGGVGWDTRGAYRPQMDVHGTLLLDSSFPGRFPRNNFHLVASTTVDHRTPMFFPTSAGGEGATTGPIDVIGARLEIRIETGTVFFQSENIVGKLYETAPGYLMPRRLQYYGLRWNFWN